MWKLFRRRQDTASTEAQKQAVPELACKVTAHTDHGTVSAVLVGRWHMESHRDLRFYCCAYDEAVSEAYRCQKHGILIEGGCLIPASSIRKFTFTSCTR